MRKTSFRDGGVGRRSQQGSGSQACWTGYPRNWSLNCLQVNGRGEEEGAQRRPGQPAPENGLLCQKETASPEG